MKKLFPFFLMFLTLFLSCENNQKNIKNLTNIYATLKKEYAPDKRIELFDIQFKTTNNQLILEGETTTEIALQTLMDSLQKRNVLFKNNVRVLPDSAVGLQKFGVARNSVINIRSKPKHAAELGTQGLLGMPLKILDKKGDFYRVQTPDNYISWVDKGGITTMNTPNFNAWETAKKIIFTKNFGYVFTKNSEKPGLISDITLGGTLKLISESDLFFYVEFPDGRTGFVKKTEAEIYDNWLKNTVSSAENIEKTAKKLEGFPYLWGGTSSKGMDCSGFTKVVYLMNGFVIPRDASQQISAGKKVDEHLKFEDLQKGDLLFFGKKATANKKQRVTHVGIWLGNQKGEFIHALGNVHLSSIDENSPIYDEFNKNRYLGSKRYLGEKDAKIIDLKIEK